MRRRRRGIGVARQQDTKFVKAGVLFRDNRGGRENNTSTIVSPVFLYPLNVLAFRLNLYCFLSNSLTPHHYFCASLEQQQQQQQQQQQHNYKKMLFQKRVVQSSSKKACFLGGQNYPGGEAKLFRSNAGYLTENGTLPCASFLPFQDTLPCFRKNLGYIRVVFNANIHPKKIWKITIDQKTT